MSIFVAESLSIPGPARKDPLQLNATSAAKLDTRQLIVKLGSTTQRSRWKAKEELE